MSGYEAFQSKEEVSPSDLSTLARLAEELTSAEIEVSKAEEALAKAKAQVTDLSERQIPDLMDHLNLKTFTTKSGFRVEVKRTIRASIPAGNREQAYKWLDEHGHSGLIKRSILVAFDRDQEKEARKLERDLGKKFENVKTDLKVEPSTLRAFIGEQLEKGEDIPLELFGAFEQRFAKITLVGG